MPPGGAGGTSRLSLTAAAAPPAPGILWNLSSSDHLKDRLARDTLEQLTDLVLSPLSGAGGPPLIQQNASEAEIFYNATGFLRCMGRGQSAGRGQEGGHGERAECLEGDRGGPEKGPLTLRLSGKVELAGEGGLAKRGAGADAEVGQEAGCG